VARIIIPDLRALLTDIRATADGVEVHIAQQIKQPLYCAVLGRDIHGGELREQITLDGSTGTVVFSRTPVTFRLYVLDQHGECYDQHDELRFAAQEGESLFASDRPRRRAEALAIDEALRSGEDLHTEYKRWLPVDRGDAKADELFETAVAFANAEGGSIFIGIADHGELVNCDKELRRMYRKEGSELEVLRARYVEDLNKRIATEIRPRLTPTFGWLERDGAWVLRIQIDPGTNEAFYIDRSSECYVRRGATNRRASPPEIERLNAERRPRLA
jgi:hypothetical protein